MEAPHLSKITETYASQGLVVLAPNAWDEEKGLLKRYVKKENLKQRVLLNAGEVFSAYGAKSVPTVLFIDKSGVVVDVEIGFDHGPAALEERVKKLLAIG